MIESILECARNFGAAPRKFSLWDRLTYFRVPRPRWILENPADELATHFRNLKPLFVDGIVTWGYIIQANVLMFEDGQDNCPGELVYSVENHRAVAPAYLQYVAGALFRLKQTQTGESDLQPIADYLTDEMIRVFGLPVPKSVSPKINCKISTTYFVRKHLPQRRLCSSLLPIVVSRQEPYVVTPLPERYWPESLIDWWQTT